MIKSDKWTRRMAVEHGLIDPYLPGQVREVNGKRIISAGQGSFGYDFRCADEFKVFTDTMAGSVVDPKNFDENCFMEVRGRGYCIIPPNSFALTRSIERFKLPRNVTGICIGKSSYARCGVVLGITPLEAGWEGFLTIEVSNTTPLPAKIYANEGIGQCVFFEADENCETAYDQRPGQGKYNNQGPEIVLPRI